VKRSGGEELYLGALAAEASARADASAAAVETLYIGGGTPSVLSPEAWRTLVTTLERIFSFSAEAEVTVEANPGSLTAEHLRLWREWRVTRVSVGVQSFDDAELAFLGRPHTAAQAADAAAACIASGFSVSLDLMLGLPGQSLRDWARSLRAASALSVRHLSIYQLTIEPNTPFASRGFALPDGYAPYRYAQWLLPRRGLAQYEVASFAEPGYESRHNLVYWADGAYLGLGPAAWSYDGYVRGRNEPELARYAELALSRGTAFIREERLSPQASARQAAVLALRTASGVDWQRFGQKHGEETAAAIRGALAQFPPDLVNQDPRRAFLTPKGLRVANRIWEELL